jgi:N utilization substance protein A
VVVKEDQQSLARGRGGQNVRLASRLVGWRIEILTHDELNEAIDRAEDSFRRIPEVSDTLVERLIENGLFRYRDLASLTPEKLVQLGGSTYRQAEAIIRFAAEHDEAENWW